MFSECWRHLSCFNGIVFTIWYLFPSAQIVFCYVRLISEHMPGRSIGSAHYLFATRTLGWLHAYELFLIYGSIDTSVSITRYESAAAEAT